jgi:hypothetical protein
MILQIKLDKLMDIKMNDTLHHDSLGYIHKNNEKFEFIGRVLSDQDEDGLVFVAVPNIGEIRGPFASH